MRVLIVEDDKKISSFIAKGLREANFAVDEIDDGETGFKLLTSESYDAAVIDVMLPKLDGLSIVEQIRERGNRTPVIVLSARRSVDDRIRGLQGGGEYYLTKPFSFAELLARVYALLRRAGEGNEPTKLVAGELSLDLLTRNVARSGKKN